MKCFVKEISWLKLSETGWGNGYVVIPKNHPLHGVYYDDIDIDIHGGLTFSEEVTDKLVKAFETSDLTTDDVGKWIIGFDCAHYGDTISSCPKQYVESETKRLLNFVKKYKHEKQQ